jgi:hypothetical protein
LIFTVHFCTGYWFGDGSMSYHGTAPDSLLLQTVKDVDYLRELLVSCGLVEKRDWYQCRPIVGGAVQFYLTTPRWFQYFDGEYWLKYRGGRARRGEYDDGFESIINARERIEVDEMEISPVPPPRRSHAYTPAVAVPSSSSSAVASSAPAVSRSQEKGKSEERLEQLRRLGVEPPSIKSAKWFWWWVLRRLSQRQMLLVLRGLRVADGHWARTAVQQARLEDRDDNGEDTEERRGSNLVYTSSVSFREQIVQACLHAGFSPTIRTNSPAGPRNAWCTVPYDGHVYNAKQRAEVLASDPDIEFRQICANAINWSVDWSEREGVLLDVDEVRFDGRASVRKALRDESDWGAENVATGVTKTASSAARLASAYDAKADGRLWCVELGDDTDHLLVAQRALVDPKSGEVTQMSRPLIVGNCLTITAKRLGQMNVFVKQLQSVETLGSVTVIATDKTGTLTMNKMAVANMWLDGTTHTSDSIFQHFPPHRLQRKATAPAPGSVAAGGDLTNGEGIPSSYHIGATLEQLELIAVICSKTRFEDERQLTPQQAKQMEQVEALKSMDPSMTLRRAKIQFPTLYGKLQPGLTMNSGRLKMFEGLGEVMMDDSTRVVQGDASETALFNFVRQRQSIELLRYHHPIVYQIPFNSRNKYAITITRPEGLANESPQRRTLMMKGAPEVIIARCSHYMRRGEIIAMDERFKSEFQQAYESFGSKGQRVLGFAMLDLPEADFGSKFDAQYAEQSAKIPTSGLVFCGLISLVDPPKPSVPQAVLDWSVDYLMKYVACVCSLLRFAH